MGKISLNDVYNYVDEMIEVMPGTFLGELIATHEYHMEESAAELDYIGGKEGLGSERYLIALEKHKQLHDIYNRYFRGILDDN